MISVASWFGWKVLSAATTPTLAGAQSFHLTNPEALLETLYGLNPYNPYRP